MVNPYTLQYDQLLQKIEHLAYIFGFKFRHSQKSRSRIIYCLFVRIFFISYFLMSLRGIFAARQPLILSLRLASLASSVTSIKLSYVLTFKTEKIYKILERTGKLQKEYCNEMDFQRAFSKAYKAIKIVLSLNFTRIFLVTWMSLISQLIKKPVWITDDKTGEKRFNIRLPWMSHLPFLQANNWKSFAVNFLQQLLGFSFNCAIFAIFMVIVSVLVVFAEASMGLIVDEVHEIREKLQSQSLKRYWERKSFGRELKKLFELHETVTENIKELIGMTANIWFLYECMFFMLLVFFYIAFFVKWENVSLALAAFMVILLYFWLPIMNGVLFDAVSSSILSLMSLF